MADTMYNVEKCGFFDSVNQDRLYTADDMNNPYIRLVSNGVFATQAGNPANDFLVLAGDGLNVTVKAGRAIIGNKWFNLESDLSVPVSVNSGILDRMDSIIARVDTRAAARAGYIVYRTGVAATDPTPPALDTTTGVYEYRLANIVISPAASSVSQSSILDQRGSADCPWVTSLVKEVDTSVLFLQWQTAYQEYYAKSTGDFAAWMAQQKQAWSDLMDEVKTDLTATNNIAVLGGWMWASDGAVQGNIEAMVSSYNADTDSFLLYVNGVYQDPSKYTINETSGGKHNIQLNNEIVSNYYGFRRNIISVTVFKSIVASNLQSTMSLISALDSKVTNFMSDSGWTDLALTGGAAAFDSDNVPRSRRIGNRVYISGAFKGAETGATISGVAVGWAPSYTQYINAAIVSGTSVLGTAVLSVDSDGNIKIKAASVSIPIGAMVTFDGCWSVGSTQSGQSASGVGF